MKRNNVTKKDTILNVAQELFYYEGFNNTTFDIIAERCQITKPLITHHFGTKAKLGGAVFGKISNEMANIFLNNVKAIFPSIKALDIRTAYGLLAVDFYLQDKNAFRFYDEFFSSSFADVTIGIEDFYIVNNKLINSKLSDEQLHMHYIGANYAARGLIYHYVSGDIKCTREEFDRYYIAVGYSAYGISNEEIDTLITNARSILSKLEITFLPNFGLRVTSV